MRMLAVFEKSERIRHIGHLDIQRSVQRGLRRSGLPVAYSQGFNPHILITFASALSTGACGKREIMDVTLSEDVETEEFLTRIVAESAGKNADFEHVSLIEEKNFTRLAASADLTTKVIELIDHFHMQLPPLPKPLKLPPAPRQEQNRASPSKAPPRRGK